MLDYGTTDQVKLVSTGGGSAYDTWAGGAVFTDDDNGDGVTNGLAFLLGAAEVPDITGGPVNDVSFSVGAGPVGPPALNSITATIDSAAAAGGKLFGRLNASQP